jgi:phosphate butyryltransferase
MFNKLLHNVGKLPPQRLAVVASNDEIVLESVVYAKSQGLIKPILIGNEKGILEKLLILKAKTEEYKIINSETPEECAALAVKLIRTNEADLLMKGLIETRLLLKEVVNSETGIKAEKLLSHVALFSYPLLDRFIIATDCAMVINPGLEEKKGLIKNATNFARRIGLKRPKVAVISASEKVNSKLLSSVDAAILKEFFENEEDFILDGPFALDIISSASAKHKGIESPVAGNPDILVFPNLDSGNIFYKASVYLAHAEVAGLVVGAKCPIILTSRSDSQKSKLNSIALAMVYNYGLQNTSN